MAIEIERKFLVLDDRWRSHVQRSVRMAQGYLNPLQALADGSMRASLRVRTSDTEAWLNIKSNRIGCCERLEFEYPLPLHDANAMLGLCVGGRIEKTRHDVPVDGHVFEVDEFHGANQGLVVAELELPALDAPFPRPDWLGVEVSALRRYYNLVLAERPYADWHEDERLARDAAPATET
jgi:adenylate cyclase